MKKETNRPPHRGDFHNHVITVTFEVKGEPFMLQNHNTTVDFIRNNWRLLLNQAVAEDHSALKGVSE